MSGSSSLFTSVIEEHLELKRRNARLDSELPLDEFVGDDPFDNHPLFKSEDEARRQEEETGEIPAIAQEAHAATQELPVIAGDAEDEPRSWVETSSNPDFDWE